MNDAASFSSSHSSSGASSVHLRNYFPPASNMPSIKTNCLFSHNFPCPEHSNLIKGSLTNSVITAAWSSPLPNHHVESFTGTKGFRYPGFISPGHGPRAAYSHHPETQACGVEQRPRETLPICFERIRIITNSIRFEI